MAVYQNVNASNKHRGNERNRVLFSHLPNNLVFLKSKRYHSKGEKSYNEKKTITPFNFFPHSHKNHYQWEDGGGGGIFRRKENISLSNSTLEYEICIKF